MSDSIIVGECLHYSIHYNTILFINMYIENLASDSIEWYNETD